MGRGRKRKFNPTMPAHIDQKALPQGIYWEDGRWYVIEAHPEGGLHTSIRASRNSMRLWNVHGVRSNGALWPS